MCKVSCRKCGRPFVVHGIVPRAHDCFCSQRCLRESLAESSDSAYSVETLAKAPEPATFMQSPFPPRPVGMLGH